MKKVLGYVLSGIGIVITAVGTIKPLQTALKVPEAINDMYIMTVGLVIVIAGILILTRNSSSNQAPEVPIYEGKNVVGFRRMGKK